MTTLKKLEANFNAKCKELDIESSKVTAPIIADFAAKSGPINAEYYTKRLALIAKSKAELESIEAGFKAAHEVVYKQYASSRAPIDADYNAKRGQYLAEYKAGLLTLAKYK